MLTASARAISGEVRLAPDQNLSQPAGHDQALLAAAAAAMQQGLAALADRRIDMASQWLGRATRLAPRDVAIGLLHARLLVARRDSRARDAVMHLAQSNPAWRDVQWLLMRVLAHHGEAERAAAVLQHCLTTMFFPGSEEAAVLAGRVARDAGRPRWLGLTADGVLFGHGAETVKLDGRVIAWPPGDSLALPQSWRQAAWLLSGTGDDNLLGAPLNIRALRRLRGLVKENARGGLVVWVAPADGVTPELVIFDGATGHQLLRGAVGAPLLNAAPPPGAAGFEVADACLGSAESLRVFALQAGTTAPARLKAVPPGLHEMGGSPVHRGADQAARLVRATAPAHWLPRRLPAARGGAASSDRPQPVSVIVAAAGSEPAVWNAWAEALQRLLPGGSDIVWCVPGHVAPTPALPVAAPRAGADMAARLTACINAVRATHAAARDLVLLQAGTVLPPGAVPAMAALAAPGSAIATVSALHTGAGGLSVWRDGVDAATLAREAARANGNAAVPIPLPGGPCILIQRGYTNGIELRLGRFGETDGALNWWALHLAETGARHVAASGIVVAPCSALAATEAPSPRLRPARQRLDRCLWQTGHRASAVVLVTHDSGGGVERHVQGRAAQAAVAGQRPILLRPIWREDGHSDWLVSEPGSAALPDLDFAAPEGIASLAELLAADRPVAVEYHHAASHHPAIDTLAGLLGVPYDVIAHDYAAICPRVTLCGGGATYCGEPADPRDCEECVTDHGSRLPGTSTVAATRARSAALLRGARTVIAPSQDTARRLRRHVPALSPAILPWEDDATITDALPRQPTRQAGRTLRVAVLGALTRDKGFDVLLACARDAARRHLDLHFTLVGHALADTRLIDTGHGFVTGPYAEGEAPGLLAETDADIGLLPSLWPETWCYALSELWRAGLWVVAFNLGAQAERIAACGRGTLLPLGLPPARINDALLALPFRIVGKAQSLPPHMVAHHG